MAIPEIQELLVVEIQQIQDPKEIQDPQEIQAVPELQVEAAAAAAGKHLQVFSPPDR